MPTTEENIQFLYLILTQGGSPAVDWDPICDALSLEKGAVTKRWSRLKQAMEKGEKPAESNYEFLWLMVKHSTRDKSYDWDAIAEACNSTKGACSKRYSRLKIAFERGDAVPSTSTPVKAKSAPATPRKTPSKALIKSEDDGEGTPTRTPKRKRTPAKKLDYADAEEGEDEDDGNSKRTKSTPKAKPRPRNAFRAGDEKNTEEVPTAVKGEPVDDEGDVFHDAPEQAAANVNADDEIDQVLPTSIFSEKFTHAREMADVLLNRKSVLTEEQREEVQTMLAVFDDAV